MIRVSRLQLGVLGLASLLVLNRPLPSPAGALRAGAARVDITPDRGVSLDGPISKNGPVTGVHDRLYARAVVLDDGATRLAIAICDACIVGPDVFDEAKSLVQAASGLPSNRMLMAATHTHAAPRTIHIATGPIDDEYHRTVARKIAEAVLQAEKNLAPAQLGFVSFEVPGLIACRRFLCKPGSVGPNPFGETGERIKSVAGTSTAVIEPAGPVDPEVSVVSIQYLDGQQLAVLANFSVHYCGGYRRGLVSADYFGYFARAIESQLKNDRPQPVVGIMSNGTSGNTGSFRRGGRHSAPFEAMQFYGNMLAEKVIGAMEKLHHEHELDLAMCETELELKVRRPSAERLAWAEQVLAHPGEKQPHPWTRIYAQEAIHLGRFPPTVSLKLQAIRIGRLAIAAAPCEVFAETGLAIKAESPHEATFTIELANGYGGYLPPRKQHELGGYETWPARSSFLEVDAETKIRETLLELLRKVKRHCASRNNAKKGA